MSIENLKERIKETPISEILGHYLAIVPKGSGMAALCPFHNDSNPSLHIDDKKNMWFCFVDNMGGDAIKFVMERDKLEFMDALKDICEKMGWLWEEFVPPKKEAPRFELGRKIVSKAGQIYRRLAESDDNQHFQNFLQTRKIDADLANTYGLGYAPPNNVFSGYLESIAESDRDKAIKMALELGLVKPDKWGPGGNGHYDTFRDRIMFPIWDYFGKTIGFTGRAVSSSAKAKYMNSTESFLFNKKHLLYGFHLAKPSMRRRDAVILVEGNMDQMVLFGNGFEHTVAVMGVALGSVGIKKILDVTKRVYLALDNDDAGRSAGKRICRQFMEQGVLPQFVDLSPHKDPDDFICNLGRIEFQKRLDNSVPFVDWEIEGILPQQLPELPDRRLDLLHRIYEAVSPLGSSLVAKERIAEFSARLGLQSDTVSILQDYEKFISGQASSPAPTPLEAEDYPSPAVTGEEPGASGVPLSRVDKMVLQEVILYPRILLCDTFSPILDFMLHNEVKEYILELKGVMSEIDESEYRRIALDMLEPPGDSGKYSSSLVAAVNAFMCRYSPTTVVGEELLQKMISDITNKLHEEGLRRKRDEWIEKQKNSHTKEERDLVLGEIAKIDRELVVPKDRSRRA